VRGSEVGDLQGGVGIAGSRLSKEPGLWVKTYECMERAFFSDRVHPGFLGGPGEG
jgi:hypothetical protein